MTRWGTLLVCASLLLAGCTNQPAGPQFDSTQLPLSSRIGNLPFFPQLDDQCGPASLATVLSHSGIDTTPAALKPDVYLPGRRGSLALELVARARQFGRLAYILEPDLQTLLSELAAGNPVLVLQNLRFNWWPQWHFAVVTGYDLQRQQLLLRSGLEREYRVSINLFDRTWRRADRWAMLVTAPQQLPASATPGRLAAAAADLEELGLLHEAATAYRAALERWPAQPLALMGLANISYQQQHYVPAAIFYRQVIEAPSSSNGLRADAWNNLGYALQQLACPSALQAVQCAMQLRPGQQKYLDSLRELTQQQPAKKRPPAGRPCVQTSCD